MDKLTAEKSFTAALRECEGKDIEGYMLVVREKDRTSIMSFASDPAEEMRLAAHGAARAIDTIQKALHGAPSELKAYFDGILAEVQMFARKGLQEKRFV